MDDRSEDYEAAVKLAGMNKKTRCCVKKFIDDAGWPTRRPTPAY